MAKGHVEYVSADAQDNTGQETNVKQEAKSQPMAYKALVALDAMQLQTEGRKLPLNAGMQASAEILLGDQTVMEYLISPVKKAFYEAARER